MRKLLLLSLMVGALPFFSLAKDGPAVLKRDKQLHFLENKGQITNQDKKPRKDVQFSVAAGNMNVFIGDGQMHYQFTKIDNPSSTIAAFNTKSLNGDLSKKEKTRTSTYRLDVALIGANKNAQVVAEEKQQFLSRFYTIKAERGKVLHAESMIEASSYNKITYKDVYPNIDWVIYSKGEVIEYDFVVRPGGKVSDIKIKYSGAEKMTINKDGSLTATTPMGTITEKTPHTFQADGKVVSSSFALNNDVVTFEVGNYNGTLTIDPVLTWGTYFGDLGYDEYNAVTLSNGTLYVGGYTTSSAFIATDLTTYMGGTVNGYDGFVSAFTTAGALLWSTYWNTLSGDDAVNSITTAGSNVLIAASSDDLGDYDAYFGSYTTGGLFNFGYYWGDFGNDYGNVVAGDNTGAGYIGGRTFSTLNVSGVGNYQPALSGTDDGFLAKIINTPGVPWSTYYGGPSSDLVSGIKADNLGNIYVVGATISTTGMATVGQTVFGGGGADAFLAQFNANTGFRNWGTYIGGTGADDGPDVALSFTGGTNVFVTGFTNSTNAIATAGTAQQTFAGTQDAFLMKYTTAGVKTWGTYYGGNGDDRGLSVATESGDGNIFIAGSTTSTNLTSTNGFQTLPGGALDGYMAKFNTANGTMAWGSYYGGVNDDRVNSIDADGSDNFYVTGASASPLGISTIGSEQPNNAGGIDGILARFCDNPILVGPVSGTSPVCAGSSQTYTVPAAHNATSYTWTLPGGWTGTSTTNSITTTVGTTGGTVSVTASNTCATTTAQTLAVTVNPIPTATITPAGPTTFCTGGNVVLNASMGTGYSYAWFEGVTPVGTNSSSYTANAAGSYTVQITANGCSATSTAVTVTVNPLPNATASSNSAVCVGQALNLTGGSTTPGATYSWAGPALYTSNLQSPTIASAQLTNAGVYTLTVTANGCSATATTTVVVTSAVPAAPALINGDITICENSVNTYDVTNDPNASSYTWTLPTGWSGTSTTNSISATANAASGQITVTATNGCGTSTPATTLNVTVSPNPVATITQAGNTLTVTGTFASYQWYNGAGLIAGATSQSYTATSNGAHYCVVTDANGCTAQSNSITITTDVNNVVKQSSVSLYPNPNNGSFTIEGAFASNDGKASVTIVDVAGRIVHQEQVAVRNNKLNVRMDMNSSFAAGVYTIKVSSDVANAVIPFVKK